MKDEVFISYAEEDGAVASDIADGLERAGYSTWYFERDGGIPGVSYLEETCIEIEESKAFLLLMSEHSVKRGIKPTKRVSPLSTGRQEVKRSRSLICRRFKRLTHAVRPHQP
jgi:hypothetical protein